MEKFKNIFEVRKALRFELKASKITRENLEKENIYKNPVNILYKNKLEKWLNYSRTVFENDLKYFLDNSKNIILNLEKIKNLLDNTRFSEIFVEKKIFELIDKDFYIKFAKNKLSWWRSSSLQEIKKNLDWKWINLIKNYYLEIFENIENLIISIENLSEKESSFSKNEIKKFLRKISLEFIRIYNFLEKFDIKNKDFNKNLKEYIKKVINFKTFFEEIKSYYFISENQSSWILVRRFWFNEKSLKRRQPKEIKEELEENLKSFNEKLEIKEKLEEERQKLIQDFDLKLKTEKFEELLHPEKWSEIRKKKEKTKEEQEKLDDIDNQFKELKKLRNKDEEISKKTQELNRYKKDLWNLKVKINNLEKELENNLALTHYAKLLTNEINWEKLYYLVLIPIENKFILDEYISDEWNLEILEYNTLTFSALKKLALSYDWTMGIYWDKKEEINKKSNLKRWIVDLYIDLENWERQEEFYKIKRYVINLIKTYKNIFGNIYFDFKRLYDTKSLDEFKIEFDKQWYNLKWKNIDLEIIKKLEKEWKLEFYQIYNKDFYKNPDFFDIPYSIKEQKEERQRRRKSQNVKWNNNLFTIYWENFINDIANWNEEVRLNSDCWYFVKLKKEDKENHRYDRNKIIWNFGLIFNPGKKLTKKYDEKENIKKFNEIYKKEIKKVKNKSFIWIDRWEKELLTFCLIDENWNCIKNKNWEYIIWDFNLINNKWDFIPKDKCKYIDISWKEYKDLLGNFLPDFTHPENIISWKKSFQFDDEKNLYYFKLNHNARLYLLEWENKRYKIVNKEWKEIFLKDENWNNVIDYYLLFQSEVYKRHILKKTWNIKLEDVQELRWWYISNIIKQLNNWIVKYNWIIILENLDKTQIDEKWNIYKTNKEKVLEKTLWATIYQEIETLLNRKYNYFIFKDQDIWWLQLTPKVNNISDIKNLEKSKKNVNLWNIVFIDEYLTSKECPICKNQLFRDKKKWDNVYHNEKYPWNNWCSFDTRTNTYWFDFIKSWDDLAAYNIAKKGKEYIENLSN